jgi:predicted dehydrogenase
MELNAGEASCEKEPRGMMEIGIGMIGFGMMGRTHTFAYRNLPLFYQNLPFHVRLAGICSGHLDHSLQACQDFGYGFAAADYRELLARKDVDVVDICTPNGCHAEMILAAIQAGKHIYCEKPLTANAAESEKVAAALAGYVKTHQIVFHLRFYPATLRARQIIEEGRLGRIICFRASFLHSGAVDPGKPAGWRQDMELGGGGVLLDLGSHVLDMMYWLVGRYQKIIARTKVLYSHRPDISGCIREIKAEDHVLMLAEMQNGSQGTLEATKIATGSNDEFRFEIHGDKGALRFNQMDPNWLEFYDGSKPGQPMGGDRGFTRIECVNRYGAPARDFPSDKTSIGWLNAHEHCLFSFLDCVCAGRPASPSLIDGAYIQHIMAKAYESDRLGQWVSC